VFCSNSQNYEKQESVLAENGGLISGGKSNQHFITAILIFIF
jgi:hypothetical protein